MDVMLLIIIVVQFAYVVFKDILNSKEREKLQLKLMSRSAQEYVDTIAPLEENSADSVDRTSSESVFDGTVPLDKILGAQDNT